MNEYTFDGCAPEKGETTVEAFNEKEARHNAMVKRWGPPSGIYGDKYLGIGLILKKEIIK